MVNRLLQAAAAILLLASVWLTIRGAVAQWPRSDTMGRQVETGAQLLAGLLAPLVLLTRYRWRRWHRELSRAWAAALALAAGLSALVWGPPMPFMGLLFALLALAVAGGTLWALRQGEPT